MPGCTRGDGRVPSFTGAISDLGHHPANRVRGELGLAYYRFYTLQTILVACTLETHCSSHALRLIFQQPFNHLVSICLSFTRVLKQNSWSLNF
jgi:hypothetical protein